MERKKLMVSNDYLYTYKAHVVKVYDGDTITVLIDLGLNTFRKESLRLQDLNAPEVRGEEREAGLVSRDALREKILDKEIIIKTKKTRRENTVGLLLQFSYLTA